MKEFIIFVCIESTEIFFSKLRSAGLNYNLPSFFFTESYCAGVSNKHCLLTFFIVFGCGTRQSPFAIDPFHIVYPLAITLQLKNR